MKMAKLTDHYQLHQWEAGDSFLREDFNEDFQKVDTAIAGKPSAVVGSYVGAGGHGTSKPNVLTLGFRPRLVVVTAGGHLGIFVGECPDARVMYSNSQCSISAEWSDSGLSWWDSGMGASDTNQLNSEGTVYYYAAIG